MAVDDDPCGFFRFLRGEGDPPEALVVFAHPDDETIGGGRAAGRVGIPFPAER
jgi:hypothetical protein